MSGYCKQGGFCLEPETAYSILQPIHIDLYPRPRLPISAHENKIKFYMLEALPNISHLISRLSKKLVTTFIF